MKIPQNNLHLLNVFAHLGQVYLWIIFETWFDADADTSMTVIVVKISPRKAPKKHECAEKRVCMSKFLCSYVKKKEREKSSLSDAQSTHMHPVVDY